jgi:hypothetical protein
MFFLGTREEAREHSPKWIYFVFFPCLEMKIDDWQPLSSHKNGVWWFYSSLVWRWKQMTGDLYNSHENRLWWFYKGVYLESWPLDYSPFPKDKREEKTEEPLCDFPFIIIIHISWAFATAVKIILSCVKVLQGTVSRIKSTQHMHMHFYFPNWTWSMHPQEDHAYVWNSLVDERDALLDAIGQLLLRLLQPGSA